MTEKWVALTLVCMLGSGCGIDGDVGPRFRAERDLWQVDWASQNLSIRSELTDCEQWTALAREYETIFTRYDSGEAATSTTQQEIRLVSAQALLRAAEIHIACHDSLRAEELLDRLRQLSGVPPDVIMRAALDQGRIAESRGELLLATEHYQAVVDRADPSAYPADIADAILTLPLRISRLRVRDAPQAHPSQSYDTAQQHYERLVAEYPGSIIQMEAQVHLADIAADLGNWEDALRYLRPLEQQTREAVGLTRSPTEIGLLIADAEIRAGVEPESTRAYLESLLEELPDDELAPQVLLALARDAALRDEVDDAIAYLDQIRREYAHDDLMASQALLTRGRLLERDDERWPEALAAFRTVSVEHPISEAALWSHLEIVNHYSRVQDEDAELAALQRAEREYLDFVERYPPGPRTHLARERLAMVLARQEKYGEAVTELERLGASIDQTPEGVKLLVAAAEMAGTQLGDTTRAISILERIRKLDAGIEVTRWAEEEVKALRAAAGR